MNKLAILIRGASASGKTATAQALLLRMPDLVNINLESYRESVPELGLEEQRAFAHQKGLEALDQATRAEKSIVIDEQFRPEFYGPVVSLLQKRGYDIYNVSIEISFEQLKERDKGRKKPIGEERLEVLAKRAERIEGEIDDLKTGKEIRINSMKQSLAETIDAIMAAISSKD